MGHSTKLWTGQRLVLSYVHALFVVIHCAVRKLYMINIWTWHFASSWWGGPHRNIQNVVNSLGNKVLPRAQIIRWFKRSLEGSEGAEDDNGGGGTRRNSKTEIVDKGCNLISRDRRIIFGMTVIKANATKESIRAIATGEMDKRKMCTKFVPSKLCEEEKLRCRGNSWRQVWLYQFPVSQVSI